MGLQTLSFLTQNTAKLFGACLNAPAALFMLFFYSELKCLLQTIWVSFWMKTKLWCKDSQLSTYSQSRKRFVPDGKTKRLEPVLEHYIFHLIIIIDALMCSSL